jgi:hypothetical protein
MTKTTMAIILTAIISFMIGVSVGNLSYAFSHGIKDKEVVQAPPKVEPNWKVIEDEDLDYDMERDSVTLVKRSFTNEGLESTYIEYRGGKSRFFFCSREVHKKLVEKFRELLLKREAERY